MDKALGLPVIVNAWTMPIKARIDMLTTGIRTPGIKIYGNDLGKLEEIRIEIERILSNVPGTASIYAERASTGYFLDFKINREEIARYGLSVEDLEMELTFAVGGENVTCTIEGRGMYILMLVGNGFLYKNIHCSSRNSLLSHWGYLVTLHPRIKHKYQCLGGNYRPSGSRC